MKRCVWSLALICMLAPLAAKAQTEPAAGTEPAAAEQQARDEARRHFEQGVTLMEGENWEGALLEFEKSLELFPTRSALFNLGMCQKALFRYVQAMQTFEQFMEQYRDQADPDQLQRLGEVVAELRGLLAELTVNVNVPGADIYVDGEKVGTAPLMEPVQVVSGRHTIEARLEGYTPANRTLPITSGERQTIDLEMIEVARVGGIRVEANTPGAQVFVDGDLMGPAPYRGVLPEGDHEIRVEAEGFETQVQTVAIATGDERIVTVTLSEPSGTDPAWFWTLVGVTAAGAITTGALGGMVLDKNDEYEAAAANGTNTQEMLDEGETLVLATDICLGISLAAAVATLVLGFTTDWGTADEENPDADGTEVTPTVGVSGDGLGLMLVGRF